MESIDLTKQPPRSPWVQINGLYMMARTVDKLRATLPGGNLGPYRIAGFSQRLLDHIGVSEATLREVVQRAENDEDVQNWLRANTDASRNAEINRALSSRRISDQTDVEDYYRRYPVARDLPLSTPSFDVLALDDKAAFTPA